MNNIVKLKLKKKQVAQEIENLTDVWSAERFATKYAGQLAFVPQRGQWLEFDGHCWRVDEMRHVIQHAIELTRDMLLDASKLMIDAARIQEKTAQSTVLAQANKLVKHAQTTQAKPKLEALLSIAATYDEIAISQSMLDCDEMLLGVQNGVIELETSNFRNGRPEDFVTRQSLAEWRGGDADVECPVFEKFLQEVQPDPDVRHWLQKFVGYCLTGATSEQIFAVFQGGGANGKSVFVEIIKKILGEYAKTVQFDTFTEADKSAIRNDLAALDKVRFVLAQEGGEGARLDEGIVKQLTGGDEVTARFLHREFFSFTPKFKVVLVTNHKPQISGSDNGIWRRVVLVPWPVTIPAEKRDKKLLDKLTDELPGILAWAVTGFHKWREQGLGTLPPALIMANASYRKDSDIVGMWLDDCIEVGAQNEQNWVAAADLYGCYEEWAKCAGHRPLSQTSLGNRLRERGFEQGRPRGIRSWRGLKLKR